MTSLEEIKSRYALLSDGELIGLLLEPASLRQEAFIALREECTKRGIDKQLVVESENRLPVSEPANIRGNITREQKKWWAEVKAFAFEQKYNDVTDDMILAGLIGMRASNEESLYVINKLDDWAAEEVKNALSDRIGGITRAICGMAVIIIVLLVPLGNMVTILGGLLCIGGLLQVANASYRRKRYMAIQNNISRSLDERKAYGDEEIEFTEIL